MLNSRSIRSALACVATLAIGKVAAVDLDVNSPDSIRNASKLIATDMMAYYVGNQPGQTPGYLPGNGVPGGYFWWIGGGMFGAMVDYWYYTGDSTWNDLAVQAIAYQADPSSGGFFDSPNVSFQLGNDDQAFWAFAAMDAAEYVFPNPPADSPSWLAMAQGVFNQQVQRWDNATCGGGLRWQAVFANPGYNYKNSISNGAFFHLAARLGKYTGNDTYIYWAAKTWAWSVSSGLIEPNSDYTIIDGIYVDTCTTTGGNGDSEDGDPTAQWSYNVGIYLYGAACMWNITQTNPDYANMSTHWQTVTNGLLQRSQVFFQTVDNDDSKVVLTEVICENTNVCSVDATTFKSYTARWLRATAIVAPFTAQKIGSMMAYSPVAAAEACNAPGMNGGVMCGQQWYLNPSAYDGRNGIGEQMAALEVIYTLLPVAGPVAEAQGNSMSDPSAGSAPIGSPNPLLTGGHGRANYIFNVTTADRGGAWFIFVLLSFITMAGAFWILRDGGFDIPRISLKKRKSEG